MVRLLASVVILVEPAGFAQVSDDAVETEIAMLRGLRFLFAGRVTEFKRVGLLEEGDGRPSQWEVLQLKVEVKEVFMGRLEAGMINMVMVRWTGKVDEQIAFSRPVIVDEGTLKGEIVLWNLGEEPEKIDGVEGVVPTVVGSWESKGLYPARLEACRRLAAEYNAAAEKLKNKATGGVDPFR